VHDAYLRVDSTSDRRWDKRGHFFAAAAMAMRRILVERARHRQRLKHGAGAEHVEFDSAIGGADPRLTDLVAVDEALTQLEQADPRKAHIVTLRYFAGLSIEETAAALDLSPATVKNEWQVARAWLYPVLGPSGRPPSGSSWPSPPSSPASVRQRSPSTAVETPHFIATSRRCSPRSTCRTRFSTRTTSPPSTWTPTARWSQARGSATFSSFA